MELEERLKKIIAEKFSVEEGEITTATSFKDDLNADSLDLIELVMALEEEFELEVPDEDAEKIQTMEDALRYLKEHGVK
ncbi:MAG: acyl carrier protein [bacterium]